MAEPDVTADDVQRFLKEVAKREVCPSCGTEEEPTLLIETEQLTKQAMKVRVRGEADGLRETINLMLYRKSDHLGYMIRSIIGRYFTSYQDSDLVYVVDCVTVLCPICGKLELFALDRMRDWMKGQTDG